MKKWEPMWDRFRADILYDLPCPGAVSQLCCAGAVNSRGDIPNVQGKEQWLHFAGAAMKRYPTSKVRETQVRR